MLQLSRHKTYLPELALVMVFGILQGCASTAESPQHVTHELEHNLELPYGAKLISNDPSPEGRAMFRDMQLALKSRNLYQTMGGDISYIKGQCPIDVIAHRGSSDFAENSRDAIRMAAVGGFNGAEIDVMLTRDKKWVVHHDIQTGRAVGRADGKRFRISQMNSKEWNSMSGRNPDGTLNGYRPAYFEEAVNDWYHYATPKQTLNIEIKTSEVTMSDLHRLNSIVAKALPYKNFFYSSMDMDVLEKMREINPGVYLGYVWEPHPTSIAQFKRDAKRGINSDDYYKDNKKYIDKAFAMEGRYRKTQPKHSARVVKNRLGAKSGLHVDIRSYHQHATIHSRTKAQGLKVVTYTINGTQYHQNQLVALAKQNRALPDEAIMDTSKFSICQQLNPKLVTSSQGYQPTTIAGKAIVRLPNDADFEQLYEQLAYLESDHYITNQGRIRMVSSPSRVSAQASKPSLNKVATTEESKINKTEAVSFGIEDEDFDLSTEAISIALPTD